MAKFNPSAGEVSTPDFTGASKGIRGGLVEADTSVADLFEGLGQGALLGVQAADQGIQAEIQDDVNEAFDQMDNEFGVTAAAEQENRANADDVWGEAEATPKELRDAETQLSGLHAAVASGQLKESHYWARAQSIVRQLKGRYPGYQNEIDTMVSNITGVRPANALRRSLFQEWGEGAGDGEKRRQALIASISADESFENILPDFWERENSGNPYTTTQINEARSKWNAEESANRKRQSRLAVLKEDKKLTEEAVTAAFNDEITTKSETLMQQALVKLESGEGKSLMEMVIEATVAGSQGEDWDAETARRLGQASEAARLQYERVFDELLNQQWEGSEDPDATYRRNMSDEAIKEARERFMKPFERIERALTHKDFGILRQASLKHEAMKQDVTNTFVDENPQLDILFVLPELWGAAVFEQVMAHNPKLRTVVAELTHRIIEANKHIKARDGENDPNVVDDLEQVRNDDRISDADASDITNAITQKHINVVKNIGTEMELPPEILEAELSYMFNEKNFRGLQALSPEARREFFSRVSSPAVTKKMEHLKKDGRTELWDMYQTYVAHEFETLFQEDVASIQDRILQPDAYDIQWNPQKLQFEFKPNPELSPVQRRNMEQAGLFGELEEARRRINAGIRVVAPIIEANDRDAHIELYRLMQDMGLDEQAEPGETTVFQGMMEALELQFMLGAEDVRKGDLPLLGIRGAERLGKNVSDFTEPLRKSIWDTLRPFSAPFRAPEERRGDQGGRDSQSELKFPDQQTSSPSSFILPSGNSLDDVVSRANTPIDLAQEFLGARETVKEDNNALSMFFQKSAGISINPATTPWCAAFANSVLASLGQEGTGSLAAKSFLNYGEAVDTPEVGDLVIFDRGKVGDWQGHVGFFQGFDEQGNILVLGGNQSAEEGDRGSVNVKAYSPKRLEGYRRPPQIKADMPEKDKQVLREIGLPPMKDVSFQTKLEMLETMYG